MSNDDRKSPAKESFIAPPASPDQRGPSSQRLGSEEPQPQSPEATCGKERTDGEQRQIDPNKPPSEYDFLIDLRKSNATDEWELQKFSSSAVFSLIATNWLIANEYKSSGWALGLFILSLLVGLAFLFLRILRQTLNVWHNRKIMNDCDDVWQSDNPLPCPHNGAQSSATRFGRWSDRLYWVEQPILWISFAVFVAGCVIQFL